MFPLGNRCGKVVTKYVVCRMSVIDRTESMAKKFSLISPILSDELKSTLLTELKRLGAETSGRFFYQSREAELVFPPTRS